MNKEKLKNVYNNVTLFQNPQKGTTFIVAFCLYPQKFIYHVNWKNKNHSFERLEEALHFFNCPYKLIKD